jgi:hypothetical protein
MLGALLLIGVSLVLVAYWFRYTCGVVLRGAERDYAARVAAANGLCFPEVHGKLKAASPEMLLDPLDRSLDRDYRMVRYLLLNAAGWGIRSSEQRLLLWDYGVMQLWYRLVGRFWRVQARKALEERSQILAYFAHQMGRRTASQAA